MLIAWHWSEGCDKVQGVILGVNTNKLQQNWRHYSPTYKRLYTLKASGQRIGNLYFTMNVLKMFD